MAVVVAVLEAPGDVWVEFVAGFVAGLAAVPEPVGAGTGCDAVAPGAAGDGVAEVGFVESD